ncbi:MAG: DUF3160 domain-containing protein [Candidatus Tectomicrobia bacterium]|nr:DUF3160 domain-containing protein [Candidatus Tectomicrobia bacterium]
MAIGNRAAGRCPLVRGCWRSAFLWAVVCMLMAPGWGAATEAQADLEAGLFEVYARNKQEGVPNYVTEDLLLLSYGMIRVAVDKALERERYIGMVSQLVEGLAAQVTTRQSDEVNRANLDYLAVLTALAQGRDRVAVAGDPPRAQAELDLVMAAQALARSPLWERTFDYTQFRPRGHYGGDAELERYFRTVRYAGTALFAITASQATGVSSALAERMTLQAVRLAQVIERDAGLRSMHRDLMHDLTWRVGPPEDIRNDVLLDLDAEPAKTFRSRLLTKAKEEGWQPRIISGVVDANRLEEGVTAADVMTGWRLLPQRYTPESAAFQQLVFDATGEFQGAQDTPPFGLTLINGQAVKGFPLLAELMATWGSQTSSDQLRERGETAFAGYDEALTRAQQALGAAEGLSALHQQLMQTGLRSPSPDRLQALRAFWTWQRYAALLYAKQSYTMAGKGLDFAPPRAGAWLEPSLPLYQALARVVEGHRRQTPHDSWDAFAEILDRVITIASRELLQTGPTAADEQFLNDLDTALTALTGGPDAPIVVDVHTNPASREVLQEATGMPRVVAYTPAGRQTARGARLTQCEFKHPMADRLDDASWRSLLASTPHACAVVDSPVHADDKPETLGR